MRAGFCQLKHPRLKILASNDNIPPFRVVICKFITEYLRRVVHKLLLGREQLRTDIIPIQQNGSAKFDKEIAFPILQSTFRKRMM